MHHAGIVTESHDDARHTCQEGLQPELEELVPLEVGVLALGVHLAARLKLDIRAALVGTVDLRGHEDLHPCQPQAEHLLGVRGESEAWGWG